MLACDNVGICSHHKQAGCIPDIAGFCTDAGFGTDAARLVSQSLAPTLACDNEPQQECSVSCRPSTPVRRSDEELPVPSSPASANVSAQGSAVHEGQLVACTAPEACVACPAQEPELQLVPYVAPEECAEQLSAPTSPELKFSKAKFVYRICGKQTIKLDKRGRSAEYRRKFETSPRKEKTKQMAQQLLEFKRTSTKLGKECLGVVTEQWEKIVRDCEAVVKERDELKAKLSSLESENKRLKEEKEQAEMVAQVEHRLRCEAYHEGLVVGRNALAGRNADPNPPRRVTLEMIRERRQISAIPDCGKPSAYGTKLDNWTDWADGSWLQHGAMSSL